ncbi:MAG: hypothetical protein GVY20_02060 [Bacteroidetes bacterium]|jgi:hypothetical protein|nr:hypothetical protein [Bacteroidota bacterium]
MANKAKITEDEKSQKELLQFACSSIYQLEPEVLRSFLEKIEDECGQTPYVKALKGMAKKTMEIRPRLVAINNYIHRNRQKKEAEEAA